MSSPTADRASLRPDTTEAFSPFNKQVFAEGPLDEKTKPRVIVIGAGFGGLEVARARAGAPVGVMLVDRVLDHDFPTVDAKQAEVMLIEMADHVLPPYDALFAIDEDGDHLVP